MNYVRSNCPLTSERVREEVESICLRMRMRMRVTAMYVADQPHLLAPVTPVRLGCMGALVVFYN